MFTLNSPWSLSSRVHQLNVFPATSTLCYVKRDDELSAGISGTKLRKYASLIPFFINKHIKHLVIVAGPQSNNLLAALQIARELKLEVSLFLLRPKHQEVIGNYKLSLLFMEQHEIHWIERQHWVKVHELAYQYASNLNSAFVLEEGASVPEAMDGAMSLAHDIIRNEAMLGFCFQHIFIDAGTGFSAAGLIKGLILAKHPALVHVLLLADTQEQFEYKLKLWTNDLTPRNYCCFYPQSARSFGSVNKTIKNEIKRIAKEEGMLVDPIYSAKLFYETRRYIVEKNISGTVLIVHSGGILTLAGFSF